MVGVERGVMKRLAEGGGGVGVVGVCNRCEKGGRVEEVCNRCKKKSCGSCNSCGWWVEEAGDGGERPFSVCRANQHQCEGKKGFWFWSCDSVGVELLRTWSIQRLFKRL